MFGIYDIPLKVVRDEISLSPQSLVWFASELRSREIETGSPGPDSP